MSFHASAKASGAGKLNLRLNGLIQAVQRERVRSLDFRAPVILTGRLSRVRRTIGLLTTSRLWEGGEVMADRPYQWILFTLVLAAALAVVVVSVFINQSSASA